MKCSWCEEEGKKMFRGCNIKGHDVCEECYGKYRKMYPLRVDGCPYCIGIEEVAVEEVAVEEVAVEEVASENHFDDCNSGLVSVIIFSSLCIIFIVFLFSRIIIIMM
tara:strand:+ start:1247 stop:1567 length:321 start_codon:yes stop_codon:yes gene_type:complete